MATPEETLARMQARKQAEAALPPPAQANISPPMQTPAPAEAGATPEEQDMLQQFQQRKQAEIPAQEATPGLLAQAADIFTGALRETPETKALPELASARGITSGSFINDLQTAAGLMFASNDEAKKDIIKSNFPGTEIKSDAKGNEIITFPDGRQAVLNKPGFSFQDALGLVGDIAAFFGPAKLAGLGKSLATRVGIGAAAEAGTEAALQKGVQALGSEQPVSALDVTAAGLTAGVGEIGGAAVQALRRRGARKALGTEIATDGAGGPPPAVPPAASAAPPMEPEKRFVAGLLGEVEKGEELTKKTGIPLFRAQKTMDPTDIDRQSYVSLLSGGSRVAVEALKNQNKKSYDAVVDFLATVAPERQVAGAAVRARSAAQMVTEAQKELRQEAAGKFYKEAFKDKSRYNPEKTLGLISEKTSDAGTGSALENSMKRISRFLTPKGTAQEIAEGLTLQQLHEVKRSVDDMIGKTIRKGENKLAGDLLDVKKSLLTELQGFSPAYDQGRRQFAAQSPAVEALENSLIGRVASLKDTQLKNVTSSLFDPADVGTSVPNVKTAKKAIQQVDPGAWNDVVRLELEKRLGTAQGSLETIGETTRNAPGILKRALFGSKKKRDILYAALDGEQKKNMRYLEDALDRASKGRPGGSPTATRLRFEKEIAGTGGKIAGLFKPLTAASKAAQEFNFDKNAFALAQVMFDPKWRPDMRKLRKFKPDSPEGAAFFSDMMSRAAKDFRRPAVQAARPETE